MEQLPPLSIYSSLGCEPAARAHAVAIAKKSMWYDLANRRHFNDIDRTGNEPHIRADLLEKLDIVIVNAERKTPDRNTSDFKLLFAGPRNMSRHRTSWDNASFHTDFLIHERGFTKVQRSSLFIHQPPGKDLPPMIMGLFINGRTLPSLSDMVQGHGKLYSKMQEAFNCSPDRPGIIMAGVRVNRNSAMQLTTSKPNTCGYYTAKSSSARRDLANPDSVISRAIRDTCKLQCDLEAFVSPMMGTRRRGVKLVHPGLLPHIPRSEVPALAMGISKGIMNPLHSDEAYGGLTETITFNTCDVPVGAGLTFCLYACGILCDLQSHHANLIMVPSELTHGTPGLSPASGVSSHGAIGLAIHTKGTFASELGQLGLTTLFRRVHEDDRWRKFRGEQLFTTRSPINCLSCGEGGNSIPCGEPECVAAVSRMALEEEEEEVELDHQYVVAHEVEEEEEGEGEEEDNTVAPPPRGLACISWDCYEDGTGGVENEALMPTDEGFVPLWTPINDQHGRMDHWRVVDVHKLSEGSYSYVRLQYYPRDSSAPCSSSSPSTSSDTAARSCYSNLRLMCQMRDRSSREKAMRSILLRVEEPEVQQRPRKKRKKKGAKVARSFRQLWWSPFHNHFFTCEEGDSMRDQVDWQQVSMEGAQSMWPDTPLREWLATGIVFFEGGKNDQLELQLEDWSKEEYKSSVCKFFGLSSNDKSKISEATCSRRDTRSTDRVSWDDFASRHQGLVVGGWWLTIVPSQVPSAIADESTQEGAAQPGVRSRSISTRSYKVNAGRVDGLPTPPIVDQAATILALPPPPSPAAAAIELRRSTRPRKPARRLS